MTGSTLDDGKKNGLQNRWKPFLANWLRGGVRAIADMGRDGGRLMTSSPLARLTSATGARYHRPAMTSRLSADAVPNAHRYLPFPILVAMLSCGTTSGPSSVAKTCTITATSVIVNAGDTLRMTFTVPASSGGADVLQYELDGLPSPLVPGPSESCQLFDGDRLLGTDGTCGGSWQSSTASVRLPGVPQIDFSTVAAGTLAGRMDFRITGGSWAFDSKGTISLSRTIQTERGPSLIFVAAGTASPLQLIGPSCR
jgi:hypothetical protein